MVVSYHGYTMEIDEDVAYISNPDGEQVSVMPTDELPADEFSCTRKLKAWVEHYERTVTVFLANLQTAGIEVEPVEPHRLH